MEVDLCIFAGQSNMAGRGISNEKFPQTPPKLIAGAGYEFRAISNPTKLVPLVEPFGVNENTENGINDVFEGGVPAKTGSLVTAFCNSCYQETGIPIVGVSASKGGSHIRQWQRESSENYLVDSLSRYGRTKKYLIDSGHSIRHSYVLWCQGESDGDLETKKSEYLSMLQNVFDAFCKEGLEHIFLIQIGYSQLKGATAKVQEASDAHYDQIHEAIEDIAKLRKDTDIVARSFMAMRKEHLMKDEFHYYQHGYNLCGEEAGRNVGRYLGEG